MAGRPTKYKDEYAEQAKILYKKGFTDLEVAEFFGVTTQTIFNWHAKHEAFFDARTMPKDSADDRVARSLFERAMGYSHEEDKVMQVAGKIKIVPTIKHYPPDTSAMIFWLKNRKPKEWRDKPDEVGETSMTGVLEQLIAKLPN